MPTSLRKAWSRLQTRTLTPGVDVRAQQLVIFATLCIAWAIAWWVRRGFASPNVDDYLYTMEAARLWAPLSEGHAIGFLRAAATTGQYGPLFLTLSAPLAPFGPDVVVLAQFPLLLALSLLVYTTIRRYRSARVALVAVALTVLSPPVLTWSVMAHMGLASSVCSFAVLAAYLVSEGFRRLRPSLLTGVALGLLSLSRSIAIVYVAAAGLTVLAALLLFHRRFDRRLLRNVVAAAAATLLVAGPWYWKSGTTALRYLTGAGYSSDSSFIAQGNRLALRVMTTLSDTGYVLAAVILGLLSAALWRLLVEGRRESASCREARFALTCFSIAVMVALSTSGVPGTAFELPALAVGLPGLILLVSRDHGLPRWVVGSVVVVIPLAVAQSWLVSGWEGRRSLAPAPLYASGAYTAAGRPIADVESLNTKISQVIGDDDVFIVRDDAIINANALAYLKQRLNLDGVVRSLPFDRDRRNPWSSTLHGVVVTGTSCAPYHINVDSTALEKSLRAARWTIARSYVISGCNSIEVWRARE